MSSKKKELRDRRGNALELLTFPVHLTCRQCDDDDDPGYETLYEDSPIEGDCFVSKSVACDCAKDSWYCFHFLRPINSSATLSNPVYYLLMCMCINSPVHCPCHNLRIS